MHGNRWLIGAMALAVLAAAGCWYRRPNIERMYGKTAVGMSGEDVIKVMGRPPTTILENEMFYIYDDPPEPVRLRFVLDESGVVCARYYEPKRDLARKAEETKGEIPPPEPLPGEEARSYPGGPLDRFRRAP